jgi:hypothetical protein
MYLNNKSNSTVVITLTTQRTLPPVSSLNLNDKDVLILRDMIANRPNSKMFVEQLSLSNFKIEETSIYESLLEQYGLTDRLKKESKR